MKIAADIHYYAAFIDDPRDGRRYGVTLWP